MNDVYNKHDDDVYNKAPVKRRNISSDIPPDNFPDVGRPCNMGGETKQHFTQHFSVLSL